jgi:hypothetical protein
MGILDEAIREHLELKRQHGAGEPELKQLEDEAFGPSERPGDEEEPADELAEAPTEFMAQPEGGESPGVAEEGPEADGEEALKPPPEQPPRRREPAPEIADLQEGPEPGSVEPAEEEAPAMEHEAIRPDEIAEEAQPEPSPEPSAEERQAITDQPTELYDVEGEEFAGPEPAAPSEDELVEEEIGEPRLGPVDPLAEDGDDDVEEASAADEAEDDFFDEKRLSDELDQALEAPAEPEPEEAEGEEPSETAEEDLLEETPDFLEGAPEDDQLWFEQKPPKDFDFDD